MKWLVVVCSLVVGSQVYAEGLCKPLADGKGASDYCIAGWDGAENAVAYAGALAAMLDKLTTAITFDSFINQNYEFAPRCKVNEGNPNADPPEPSSGCMAESIASSEVNASLVNAFHRTLGSARLLLQETEGTAKLQLIYRIGTGNNVQLRDKIAACATRYTHNKVAPLWNNFADNWKKDYKAYKDKYRKKIFKTYFTAIKRLYGIYASRMKKLMKKVGRDYDCDL